MWASPSRWRRPSESLVRVAPSDRVGVPQDEAIPASRPAFYGNLTVSGGPDPVRAYIDELLPGVLEGRIQPGRVFDRVIGLDSVLNGYRAMNDREAIKVMVEVS